MTKRIFRSTFAVAAAMLLACIVLIMGVLYEYFGSVQENQMKTALSLAAHAIETGGGAYLDGLESGECRLTWIGEDGSVLYDSQGDAAAMENHARREEFMEAMETGTGESARYSATLMERTVYYARRLSDGTVLRASVSRMTVPALVLGMLQPIMLVVGIAVILSLLLSHRAANNIVKPLNSLNLDSPLENDVYEELTPLLTQLERQQRQIRAQSAELARRQEEFLAVTRNMEEGLILLSPQDVILSINPAAAAFLGAETAGGERDFLALERDMDVGRALREAKAGGHSEIQTDRNGREYQLNISRIGEEDQTSGTVILIFDVTEKAFAERSRREFTANVSHELKTPLHTIMGSAELLENGLVKPEDTPRFVGRIRGEAARLVSLIDDIIRLSQLDEGEALAMEEIDLYALAESEISTLAPAAEKRQIALSLEGETTVIKGVGQLLHEIVYNLCDNAVKYNVDGGSVAVTVGKDETGPFIRVADTGIGIPPEHQTRVFERFYRVDKSHSKETGGTGLGLSIVKHAVQYMGGKISLESAPGRGTTVTVTFPGKE